MNTRQNTGMALSVEEYLGAVGRALKEVPRARRRELLADLRDHIDAELSARPDASDADLATVFDELGTPADIADAAREELPTRPGRMRAHEIWAVILLLIGGMFPPFLGWIVGVVLLWTSVAWRTRDKVLATLLVPGGLALPFYLSVLAIPGGGATSCSGTAAVDGRPAVEHCTTTGGPPGWLNVVMIGVLVISLVGPVFSAIWLSLHARRTTLLPSSSAS